MSRKMHISSTPWLGEIPVQWNIERCKYNFSYHKDVAKKRASDYERLALTMKGVIKRPKDDTDGLQPKDFEGYQIVNQGDLVFKLIDLAGVSTSRVGLSAYDGLVSPAYILLRADENKIIKEYATYFFLSMWHRLIFNEIGNGGIRSSLNSGDLLEVPITKPSLPEQRAIVTYLDSKCAAIDDAIERHKKIIERLEEYKRASIITMVSGRSEHDVRKSGIPWMPAVPSNWDIVPLRFALTPRKNKNEGMAEDNLLTLSYGKIKRKSIDTNEGLLPASFEGYNIVEAGDIVLRLMDLQNDKHSLRTGLVTERGIITSAYVTVTPLNRFVPAFMRYLLHAYDLMKVFYSMGEGVRQGLSYDDLGRNLLIPCPPKEVQEGIASEIEKLENKVDAAIEKQDVIIAKLEEYRKSIIYNAVTGKIDCRTEASSQA